MQFLELRRQPERVQQSRSALSESEKTAGLGYAAPLEGRAAIQRITNVMPPERLNKKGVGPRIVAAQQQFVEGVG